MISDNIISLPKVSIHQTADLSQLSESDLQNPAFNFLSEYRRTIDEKYRKQQKTVIDLLKWSPAFVDLINKVSSWAIVPRKF